MIDSQPSTLLLEESGTFEGAAPVDFKGSEPGEYSRKDIGHGETGDRFSVKKQELITWITGRMSISF